MNRKHWKLAVFTSGAAASALMLAACGSTVSSTADASSGKTDKVPAEFVTMVEAATKPPTKWTGPTTSPAIEKGKTVVGIPCAKVAEGCELTNIGVKEAAEAIGWTYKTIDPAGDVNKQADAIDQAINLGANAIVLVAIDPDLMAAPLKRARAAGIKVISASTGWDDKATEHNLDYEVSGRAHEEGILMGAYLATIRNCGVKVAMLHDPEFRTVVQRYEGTIESLKKCKDSKVTGTQKFNVSDITTSLAQTSQAFFQAQRDANVGWIPYDSSANAIISAAKQAGAAKLPLVSFDANKGAIKYLADGSIIANMGFPLTWQGWAAVDAANRLMNGDTPPSDYGIPIRILTKEDVPSIKDNGYQGDIDYRAKFKQLWSTGKTDTTVQAQN